MNKLGLYAVAKWSWHLGGDLSYRVQTTVPSATFDIIYILMIRSQYSKCLS